MSNSSLLRSRNYSLFRTRLLAATIDTALAYLVLPALPILVTTRLEGNWWDWILLWGFAFHALHVVIGQLLWGRTLGKRITRLSVVTIGSSWRWLRIVIREATKAVSLLIVVLGLFFFPIAGIAAVQSQGWDPPGAIFTSELIILCYLILFGPLLAAIVLPPLCSDGQRALHDHIADTAVVPVAEVKQHAAIATPGMEQSVLANSEQTPGVGVRIGAALIDTFAIGLPIGAVAAIIYLRTDNDNFMSLFYPAFLVYNVLMHSISGATLGKKLYRLVVVTMTGARIGWVKSLVREVVRSLPLGLLAISDRAGFAIFEFLFVEFLLLSGVLVLIIVFLLSDKGALHDLAARTKVVFRPSSS